jgi:hypothetical protein
VAWWVQVEDAVVEDRLFLLATPVLRGKGVVIAQNPVHVSVTKDFPILVFPIVVYDMLMMKVDDDECRYQEVD